ncbi:hypothetical protein Clacol_006851 [Clathrus columnatus]|uniref:F-box domain-containing protein n=1 Tax=Clathrus columnatus TaxID=1419009 RepID=A0AAV5AHK2_9AGAM|nr:hypothetical protein Clacol_006851 [Clathrus columnatus]
MTTSVISTFPLEIIWKILLLLEDRKDLFSLALVQRRFYEIIIPDFLDYHTIKCPYNKEDVWVHLLKQPASWKVVRDIFLVENDDLRRKYIPRACKVRQTYDYSIDRFASALSHFSNLQSFTSLNQLGSKYEVVLKTLTDLNSALKTLVLVDSKSSDGHLPLKHLNPSTVSQLTRLEIISGRAVDNSDSLTDILLHVENLNRLVLNVHFDITHVLGTYTWKNLNHLFLGNRVDFFSDTTMDSDENRPLFTAFFKRHPFLKWLSLPLATDLNDCFPLEDVFPNLRVLEWNQITPILPSRELTLPASVARRLVHYSSMFREGWLPAFRDMSNLQSCCLGLNMDQAKYLEPLFQCAPRITKLRIELYGGGIPLYGWIKRTIDVILKMNLPLTHLLSLFNDVDMGYQTGKKETVERVAQQIPTLEYTTGCVHGKTVFLKIIRKYDTYTGFDILYDPEAVDDPYLTSWGKF